MRATSLVSMALGAVALIAGCNTSPTEPGPRGGDRLLVVAPTAATMQGGQSLRLQVSMQDEAGGTTLPSGIAWSTSDGRVASIAQDGVVTGREAGAAEITAQVNGLKAVSRVTVLGSSTKHPKGTEQ